MKPLLQNPAHLCLLGKQAEFQEDEMICQLCWNKRIILMYRCHLNQMKLMKFLGPYFGNAKFLVYWLSLIFGCFIERTGFSNTWFGINSNVQ